MPVILIADSGSTNTSWRLISDTEVSSFSTTGINPNYQSLREIDQILEHELPMFAHHSIDQVYFYGTGCSKKHAQNKLKEVLQDTFHRADVLVESDLLGACHALSSHTTSWVCILGTGSNAGVFNGDHFDQFAASLGYLLGDYGSGFNIGKKLLIDYYNGEAPDNITQFIRLNFNPNNNLIATIYHQDHPNRFIARFAGLLNQFIDANDFFWGQPILETRNTISRYWF